MKFISMIAGFRCPKCKTLLSFSELNKFDGHTCCQECTSKVRLGDSRAMMYLKFIFVFVPALLVSIFVGFAIVVKYPMLNLYLESKGSTEPNLAGFLIGIMCFVLPTFFLCLRVLKVEIVE